METITSIAAARLWRDGRLTGQLTADAVSSEELAQVAADPHCLLWVDLLRPSATELESLTRCLGLSPTAAEDALAPHERPKLTRHESHLFFTTYRAQRRSVDEEPGRLQLSRVSGIVLPTALITIRLDDQLEVDDVVRRWEEDPDLLAQGSSALVHGLLDHIVDNHFEVIQSFDDEIESLEDVLFTEKPTDRAFVRRVYVLRKNLVDLRRVVLPMREIVNGLQRQPALEDSELLRSWYQDLYDHVLRAAEWTESLRDMITSIFETSLSLQDARLNTVMKKLAAWAAIIAVPTAITGWFGQNLPVMGFGQLWGVWASLISIVASVAILYGLFRAHDWI